MCRILQAVAPVVLLYPFTTGAEIVSYASARMIVTVSSHGSDQTPAKRVQP